MTKSETLRRTKTRLLFLATILMACNQVQDLGDQGAKGADGKGDQSHDPLNGMDDGGVSLTPGEDAGSENSKPTTPPIMPVTLTTQEVCMKLLTCADAQTPSQFAQFFPVYGTNGTCFSTHSEAECRQGCVDALRTLYDPSKQGCEYCDDDTGCPSFPRSGHAGICHPTYHTCSECATDEDCTSQYAPHCDVQWGRCVECLTDEHCDVKDCSVDANKCPGGGYCEEHFNKTMTLTIRGTGLEEYEMGSHVSFDIYETLDGCGTFQYSYYDVAIMNGKFEFVRDDIVATDVTLVVDIYQDSVGGFRYRQDGLDLSKGDAMTIQVGPSDFTPNNN
jgi:hypothetical protein